MSKNKKSVLNVISISLIFFVVSLSLVGFGYGMWFDRLNIFGTIHTSHVDVDYTHVCMSSFCCGCHNNNSYTWDANHIFVQGQNVSKYCKILLVAKIKNTGSLPVRLKDVIVEPDNSTAFQGVKMYAMFYNSGNCSFLDPVSYPMSLDEGSNIVNPNNIYLDKGEYVYLTVLLIVDGGCCCSHTSFDSLHINIKLPWYLYSSCGNDYSSWKTTIHISYDLSMRN